MSIERKIVVEVERDGATTSKPFIELKVGDVFVGEGGRWFVATHLMPFRRLMPGAIFRHRGMWLVRASTPGFAHPLTPNSPFGAETKAAAFGFSSDQEIAALSIEPVK